MKLKEKSETKSWRTLCATKDLRLCFDDNGEGLNGFEQESAMIRFLYKVLPATVWTCCWGDN